MSGVNWKALAGAVLAAGVTAAALAYVGVFTGTYDYLSSPPPPQGQKATVSKPTYKPRASSARQWGGLDDKELDALHGGLSGLSPKVRVEIYCSGNYCRELAEDLDEAFESAGFDSYLETPILDMGKGAGIFPDIPLARSVAQQIKSASGGRIDLQVSDQRDGKGEKIAVEGRILIALARRAAK